MLSVTADAPTCCISTATQDRSGPSGRPGSLCMSISGRILDSVACSKAAAVSARLKRMYHVAARAARHESKWDSVENYRFQVSALTNKNDFDCTSDRLEFTASAYDVVQLKYRRSCIPFEVSSVVKRASECEASTDSKLASSRLCRTLKP